MFEGHQVEWIVDELIDDPFQHELQSAFDLWRAIVDGSPRIARELFGWQADGAQPASGSDGGEREMGMIVVGVDHSEGARRRSASRSRRRSSVRRRFAPSMPGSSATSASPGIEGSVPVSAPISSELQRRRRGGPRRDRSGGRFPTRAA